MPTIKFSNGELHHISRMRKRWYEFNKQELLNRRKYIKGKYSEPRFTELDCDKVAFIMALAGIGAWYDHDHRLFNDTRDYGNPFHYTGSNDLPHGYFSWKDTLRRYSREEQHDFIRSVVDQKKDFSHLTYLFVHVKRSRTIIIELLEKVENLEEITECKLVQYIADDEYNNSWTIRRRKLLEKWNSMIPKDYKGPWSFGDPYVFKVYDAIKEALK